MDEIFYESKKKNLPLFLTQYDKIEIGKNSVLMGKKTRIGKSLHYRSSNSVYLAPKRMISSLFNHNFDSHVF